MVISIKEANQLTSEQINVLSRLEEIIDHSLVNYFSEMQREIRVGISTDYVYTLSIEKVYNELRQRYARAGWEIRANPGCPPGPIETVTVIPAGTRKPQGIVGKLKSFFGEG